MNRSIISGVAVIFFVAGITAGAFILRDDGPQPTPIQPASSTEPTAEPEPSPPMKEVLVELWFVEGELLVRDLATVGAQDDSLSGVALAAIDNVLVPVDIPSGHDSAIPSISGPAFEVVEADGILTVGLSEEFLSAGGSLHPQLALSIKMRLAQVIFTLTQFDGIDAVAVKIDGEPLDFIPSESVDTSQPLKRADFEDLAPAITVEYPKPGATVTSPVMISGTADVFEANVNIRILDENGEVLAETFVTATCGTGCRGTYEKTVKFTVDHEQAGIIEVLTYSAEDGSPMWGVQTPVTLLP